MDWGGLLKKSGTAVGGGTIVVLMANQIGSNTAANAATDKQVNRLEYRIDRRMERMENWLIQILNEKGIKPQVLEKPTLLEDEQQ